MSCIDGIISQVPYQPYLSTQFRITYDIYLDILYGVDNLVSSALSRDDPQWCMHNVCAPCLYSLEGEEQLTPALLAAMDGNQSLKFVDSAMKYPLAVVSKLIDVYSNDIKLGYDIACSFAKTVASSSLSDRARAAHFSGVVTTFHGYSHNWGCQLNWHPLYMDGVGKEDFEGCEHLFSESNALAAGTRLSTAFHRHQAIEEFFSYWGEQKHAESGECDV
ncbi:hypothetical protein DAEQUDRAFT_676293 [Daedalea quercina L-15889]|uniref:Uncharacterized protein n=1 Tax=Daedalea quercina L-15889 TaxID=1314783 RepID=A0A165MIL2_9APHY|nr:hypothetical protein DAEQUDRAFT_676293 [Daedalea quercina L-15889]